jgi:hypothetical protein
VDPNIGDTQEHQAEDHNHARNDLSCDQWIKCQQEIAADGDCEAGGQCQIEKYALVDLAQRIGKHHQCGSGLKDQCNYYCRNRSNEQAQRRCHQHGAPKTGNAANKAGERNHDDDGDLAHCHGCARVQAEASFKILRASCALAA